MSVSINTSVLQRLLNKVSKGASNNKLLALTSLVYIRLKEGKLQLTTTDMTNYVTATEYNVVGEDFSVVVLLESFSKLVAKTTTQEIVLDLSEKSLKFVGNGTYNIELPTNEEGMPINFPMYNFTPNSEPISIKYSDIKSIINSNKSCLAQDMTQPVLTYYYCGDNVISADQYNICINSAVELWGKPLLISSIMMDLIGLFGDDNISVSISDEAIMFSSPTYCVYGKLFNAVADYPAEPIEAYLSTDFQYECLISRELLIGAIDRLSIFVDKLDSGKLVFEFTQKNITVYNANRTSYETIPYIGSTDMSRTGNFTCNINSELVKAQLMSNTDDNLHIYYGEIPGSCIKIVDGDIVKITSLMED